MIVSVLIEPRLTDILSDLPFLPSSVGVGNIDKRTKIAYIMATCHSLRNVDDELLGDPLDVKMFQFTGWSYQEGGGHVSEQPGSNVEAVIQSIAKPPESAVQSGDDRGTDSSVSVSFRLATISHFEFHTLILTYIAGIHRTWRSP